jgi:gluconate 2-dehydrogenase alpha chain
VIDEFNADNFDHTGLGFLGGGYISSAVSNSSPNSLPNLPPGLSS